MTARRTLTLRREPLAELSNDDLSRVAGAAAITVAGTTCPLRQCLDRDLSDDISCYPSCGHSGCCTVDVC